MIRWMPERIRVGGARYATAVQIIDPDRLSNPQLRFDQQTMRGGVEVDDDGAAVAYHIRKAHQGDYFSAARSMTWERIPRETEWGRPVIVHCFDRERAGQHRGVGFLTPVVNRLKMLIKYDGTELDAAIINAFFAAYIESPFDHELVEGALSADDSKLSAYQTERANYHKDRRTALGDVGMSLLFPGEKIGSVSANRPSANYDGFSSAMLRHVAAGTGLVAQQISQNWSEINYSAFRAAMLEAWKTFHRRRYDFAVNSRRPWPLRSWKSLWKWTTTHAVGTCAAFLGGKVGVLPGAVDGARQGVCGSRQGKAGCHSWLAVGLVHAGHRGVGAGRGLAGSC